MTQLSLSIEGISPRTHLMTVRFRVETKEAMSQTRTDKVRTEELLESTGGEDGSIAAVGKMFAKQRHIARLLAHLRAMRAKVRNMTEPTSETGLRMIRNVRFPELDREIDSMRDELSRCIENLQVPEHWNEVMVATRRYRRGAFNADDYVGMPGSLRKIRVSMEVGQLPESGMLAVDLPNELLAKYDKEFERRSKLHVEAAHRGHIKRATKAVLALTDVLENRERIANSVINTVRDLVDNAESRKFMADAEFEAFNVAVASILSGVSNDTVKECRKSIVSDLKATVERYSSVFE